MSIRLLSNSYLSGHPDSIADGGIFSGVLEGIDVGGDVGLILGHGVGWRGVGLHVGSGVGSCVWSGVGRGVGRGEGLRVGSGVGSGVEPGVGRRVGRVVGLRDVGNGVILVGVGNGITMQSVGSCLGCGAGVEDRAVVTMGDWATGSNALPVVLLTIMSWYSACFPRRAHAVPMRRRRSKRNTRSCSKYRGKCKLVETHDAHCSLLLNHCLVVEN